MGRRLGWSLVSVVVVLWAGCGSDDATDEDAAATTASTAATGAIGAGSDAGEAGTWPLYLVPRKLPTDVVIQSTHVQEPGRGGAGWVGVIGRPAGDGFRDVIRVLVNGAGDDREVSESEKREGSEVDVNGHRARVSDHPLTGTNLDFFTGDRTVIVAGPAGKQDEVIAVARAVKLGAQGPEATSIDRLPANYQHVAEFAAPDTRGHPGYTISLLGGEGTGRSGHVSVTAVPRDGDATAVALTGNELKRRTIRGGRDAWLSVTRHTISGRSFEQHGVAWKERPDVVVSVNGVLSEAEVLSIAEGLDETDEPTWRAAVKPRDS